MDREPNSADEPMQPTQPRGKDAKGEPAKPISIPVPKRGDFEKIVKRAARSGSGSDQRPIG